MDEYELIGPHACGTISLFLFDRVRVTYSDGIDDLTRWMIEPMTLLPFHFSLERTYTAERLLQYPSSVQFVRK